MVLVILANPFLHACMLLVEPYILMVSVHACAWQSKQLLLYDDHAVPQKWGMGSNSHEIVDNRMQGIVQSLALPSLISIPLDTSVAYS